MATVYANVTIQDVKFTEKSLGLDVKVTYVTDRVGAGASIVTRDEGEHAIDVHIDPTATTADEIVAAVAADVVANTWVTAEVTGTGTNVQTSAVRSILSGGTVAVKASKDIGPISFLAKTAGTAGNSIRVKYVNAGSISVSVASSDITVNFINNSSMAHAVAAAINASSPASALVTPHARGTYPMLVSHAVAFTNLAGGAAAAPAAVEVQDLTFTSASSDASDNGVMVTYTNTELAGSEVVTFADNTISIGMESGVSTATQIKAACDAATDLTGVKASGTITFGSPSDGDTLVANGTTFTKAAAPSATEFTVIDDLTALIAAVSGLDATDDGTTITVVAAAAGAAGNDLTLAKTGSALELSGPTLEGGVDGTLITCTISGTGATAQVTVNATETSGASAPSGTAFYMTDTDRTIKENFFEYQFGFIPSRLHIRNLETTGTNSLVLSYDGVTTAVVLAPTEELLIEEGNTIPHCISLKYLNGAPAYSIEASAVGPNLSDPTPVEED